MKGEWAMSFENGDKNMISYSFFYSHRSDLRRALRQDCKQFATLEKPKR